MAADALSETAAPRVDVKPFGGSDVVFADFGQGHVSVVRVDDIKPFGRDFVWVDPIRSRCRHLPELTRILRGSRELVSRALAGPLAPARAATPPQNPIQTI